MAEFRRIDGKAVAAQVLRETEAAITAMKAGGVTPGLAVVVVGDDPASHAYVNAKEKKCQDLGLHSVKIELPAATTQEKLLATVAMLNADDAIDGILVQSPPPPHIDEEAVVLAIDPAKDVDGFHPVNVAKLALEDPSGFVPCTPAGCQRLLMQNAPGANATVTVAHSRTRDVAAVSRRADILIAAIGRPGFVTADFVTEGAVVIDVGINRVADPSKKSGYRLVGDVAFDEVAAKCKAITPVPGGVGPMTIAMLMANTVKAAKLRRGL